MQPSSGSGDIVGRRNAQLFLPRNYVSGQPLSSTVTFAGLTLSSLGLTPGVYTCQWGSGAHADTLTIIVGNTAPSAPAPGSLVLVGIGMLALLSLVVWRRGISISGRPRQA